MQYELRTQTIEPLRPTFTHLQRRFGAKPATRYQEGTIDVQAVEHFHYRPQWDAEREIYDERFSALRLVDPYSFTDPRQYYYAPYVTARSQLFDAFAKTLDYVESRGLLAKLPESWQTLAVRMLLPLRHYEGGAQLVCSAGARLAYGTSIEQCLSFAAFDRIGNAQLLSRVGLALGGGTAELLTEARARWLEAEELQPLRRYCEELLVEPDWAVATIALDLADRLIYPLAYRHLDEQALSFGAGALSLLSQHLGTWFTDHRKWLDALITAWLADPEHGTGNAEVLRSTVDTWLPLAAEAVAGLARAADTAAEVGAVDAVHEQTTELRNQLAEELSV
ncbi:phenol 2-monooxygenase [Amycolatopsis acidiphila]|uniref:propane 2-monooxygenase n=1 Tax=Amycolatopsis acidiphila TaxID=715473 RepID=A0A558ABV0_9PSEU|nr:phenol 2-monooxygenase [Amycolatopsis acidiphila]TVT21705.1 phenol 2-monooxygenase [Amycolatopsis acidiphila]UIJ59756.1 phenol 2-monooxygenase [Amycolatopsis acidiphila]GHG98483.1 phenol hydroxylase P1 protein [Amycolatopsis acidiphila]